MSLQGCDLWIWEVDYYALKKYLSSCNWLIVQYWHPAFNHHIIFHFRRKPGCGILTLESLTDNEGKMSSVECLKYIPYPKDLRKLIAKVYGDQVDEDGYFVYDPVSTLGAFNKQYPNKSPEAKDIIRRKLIADLTFHDEHCEVIKKEMKISDLRGWVEANV